MALSKVVICFSIISLTLYLAATIVSAWPCGGLFRECHQVSADNNAEMVRKYNIISDQFLVCSIMIATSLLCCLIAIEQRWVRISAYLASFIAFVVALTMDIFFHTQIHYKWSSFLTTVATTLCFQAFVISLTDVAPKNPKPEIPLTPDLM